MTHIIKIYYFPKGLRYTALICLAGSIYLFIIGYWIFGVLLFALIFFISTAQYVTVIDSSKNEFTDAFSFYGIRIVSERRGFRQLDKIIITKGNYSQKISTRSSDRQLNWSDYTGTLIYDENGTLDLLTRGDKKELVEALKVYATTLQVTIEDRTFSRSPI